MVAALPSDGERAHEQRTGWLVQVGLWTTGCLTLLATLPAPDPDPSDHGAIVALAGFFALMALVLWAAGPSRRLLAEASPILGVISVCVLVAIATPVGSTPLFLLWPVLHTAYFSPRRHLYVVLGVMVVAYAIALMFFAHTGLKESYFTSVVVGVTVAAALINRLRQRLEDTISALRRSAATDPLTGLRNRRAFDTELEEALARSARDRAPLALAVLDVDGFKHVNDRFGHLAGDRALCRVAAVLSGAARSGDIVARLGGDEFAVLFPGAGPEAALAAARRIATALELDGAEHALPLTLSVGLTGAGDGPHSPDELLGAADAALYQAKRTGHGLIVSAREHAGLSVAAV